MESDWRYGPVALGIDLDWDELFYPPWVVPYYVGVLDPPLVRAGITYTWLIDFKGGTKHVLYLGKGDFPTSLFDLRYETQFNHNGFPFGYSILPDDFGFW